MSYKGTKVKNTSKMKGNTNGFKKGNQLNLGKHRSEEVKAVLRIKCAGWKHSEKAKQTMKDNKIGEKHWNWKGGITPLKRSEQEKVAGRERSEQCEICGAFGTICFDHDHTTGKFRGWICHRCNRTLGFVKDSPELLRRLADYLENK